ncbi:AraC-like DNA-binding protein [Paenibacillus cellulosilyticus]|uniref:AraC-like DNA-binding protein n=1 Tax=Paenibacillus cellulosilyticus TaxID=375489 RepID=A0A2V2YQY8_9BACL|nr:AraC family transcriptional regulator [Paenibacillus cellulosilyticus]PWV99466.1 AraC-like DNA-binding protein [Paenibacillus cellulosilyticus]QKS44722.1 helix-turn-helix domain-containing protein [Paenibacillus cellulosilyticus]
MNKTLPVISAEELEAYNFRLFSLSLKQHDYDLASHLAMHRHDCFEIFLVTSGYGKAQIDFQTYSFAPHTLCLISPGQMHGWLESDSDEQISGYLLVFSKDMLTEMPSPSPLHLMGENPFYSLSSDQNSVVQNLFFLLEREQSLAHKDQVAAVCRYVQLLLIEIGRINESLEQTHKEEAGFRLTKQFLTLVESHFRSVNSMSDYASMLYVTSNHLIESVRKTLGKSAGGVLRERKLLEAKRMLRYSAASVDEIANQLCYKDPSYFGRLFKKNVGVSPTEFRKQD